MRVMVLHYLHSFCCISSYKLLFLFYDLDSLDSLLKGIAFPGTNPLCSEQVKGT